MNDDIKIIQLGNLFPDTDAFKNGTAGRVYSIEGLAPTIRTPTGGGIIPQIVMEAKAISYTRDSRGNTINKHLKDVANTVHQSTGSGGNTDCLVLEPMCSVHPLSHKFEFDPDKSIKPFSPALRATDYKAPHCVYEPKIRQVGRGFNKGGDHDISPTITSNSFECNNFVLGSMQKNAYKGTTDGVSPAITAACGMGGGQTPMVGNSYRIRKLTPRECFRLMGVEDTDIDKLMSAGISNSQLYKCAGNSIVVDTLYHLFRKLFCDKESEEATYQQTLF